jgi:hypothetical protein
LSTLVSVRVSERSGANVGPRPRCESQVSEYMCNNYFKNHTFHHLLKEILDYMVEMIYGGLKFTHYSIYLTYHFTVI